ncbi:MAG: phosphoribosylformylglycinamidine synthase, partial [Gammaproteobacteria bacterium]|nr:phosphoribosylformylglycinamidine synthase [Gammaproteobacteria bacterium]
MSKARLARSLESLQLVEPRVRGVYAEFVHFLACATDLTAQQQETVDGLLNYGPRNDLPQPVGELFCVVVPRPGTISPWSSKATDIFERCGLNAVQRVERGVRWFVDGEPSPAIGELLHDRMTEALVFDGNFGSVFEVHAPRPLTVVPLASEGVDSLRKANESLGLALSEDEIGYLAAQYDGLQRDPTDVELMMFAQANSEHCRHKIFNATWEIDGDTRSPTLFDMIRNTYRRINGAGVLSAYSDNAAVIEGGQADRFFPDPVSRTYISVHEPVHILMKVETHNHPTAIAPYPGAATGSGGEIRDEGAVGRGSKPKAGLAGFTTSHLNIPGDPQPWELATGRPERIVSAFDIMMEGPIGAAGFNNEYGRPALGGYFRTFEMNDGTTPGRVWGYHKPVMIAGGVGAIRTEHINAADVPVGAKLIVLGGPAMLIGLGGGAASSMASGESHSDLDFASVQRDNAEMQRRCQEVIDRCWALGEANPIRLIHDVGAGGLSNALPELVNDAGRGGVFRLRDVPNADVGMTPMEIWCNEAQERYVMAVGADDIEVFVAICTRERCPFAIVGEATADATLIVEDAEFDNRAVDLPLATLFGKPPKMSRSYVKRARPAAPLDLDGVTLESAIERVLRFPCVASKKFLITIGDRSITGMVARDQMVGPWQVPVADVAVTLAGFETYAGEAMAMGERSPLAVINPAASARMAIGEALTNLAAAPIDDLGRVVLSANWMAAAGHDQEDQALHEAVSAAGLELCPALGIAVPVGKDSLSMRTQWRVDGEQRTVVSPVTLIVSAFAPVTDARRSLTPDIKRDDSVLILADPSRGRRRLGASSLAQCFAQLGDETPDVDDAALLKSLFESIQRLNQDGVLLAYHDRSDGGLFTTLIEMAFAGRVGFDMSLETDDPLAELFNEELGAVIEVRRANAQSVIEGLQSAGLSARVVGEPTGSDIVVRNASGVEIYRSSRADLESLWAETSYRMQRLRDDASCAIEEFQSIRDASDAGMVASASFDPADDITAPYVNRAKPRVAILREQGVNGQVEMAAAFHRAGFESVDVHMSDLFEGRADLADFNVLAACGGFSYGDVLGGGGGWAKSILFDARMRDAFEAFFQRDTLTLGVCNGCQMMAQLKQLIPGAEAWPRFVRNRSEQFEGRAVLVGINNVDSPWLDGMSASRLPIAVAHGEGCAEFDAADDAGRVKLAMQYVDADGVATVRYPGNPNGSANGLAGV